MLNSATPRSTEGSKESDIIWIPSLLGALVLCAIFLLSIVIYRRKSKFVYELFSQTRSGNMKLSNIVTGQYRM